MSHVLPVVQEYCDQLIAGFEEQQARRKAATEGQLDEPAAEAIAEAAEPVLMRDLGSMHVVD